MLETTIALFPNEIVGYIVLAYVAIYGVGFGIKNTFFRILGIFPGLTFHGQNELGAFLDAVWIVAVAYIIYLVV